MKWPVATPADPTCSVQQKLFGITPDGKEVLAYTLTNPDGITVQAMTLGGVILGIHTPDRMGVFQNIVLRHDTLAPYLNSKQSMYFGALIGRFGNRIQGGRFELDGRQFQLPLNDGPNTLHGGFEGFDQQLWEATTLLRTSRCN